MKKVLIINPHYLPGYKSGGPQQTVQNICDVFGKSNDIYLVTKDRDFGEDVPYDLKTNKWLKRYGIKIMYVSPKDYNYSLFKKLYSKFDTIYACGLFCDSTIKMLLINKGFDGKQLYVAPMGVFSKNALAIRNKKKIAFLKCFSFIGAFKKIIWSFTSKEELIEARVAIGKDNIEKFIIAEDLPRSVDFIESKKAARAKGDILKIIFLSRIVPKKNLLYAIKILNCKFNGKIQFDIYGLLEDESYWKQCKEEINKMPANVLCKYCGSVRPHESVKTFSNYDIFLFPTQGENYGHVIYEALAAGCIPIISDKTPWKDFDEKKCGSVIELKDVNGFRAEIKKYLSASKSDIIEYKHNAINYAENKYKTSVENSGYKAIFK